MKRLPMTQAGTTIHIEDRPDAVKAILIEGPQAKWFADLALHRSDLQFADSCLAELMNVPPEQTVTREVLWRSAIVYFIKCFGENARCQLSAAKIFKPEGPGAMMVFDHFRQLRNKHFIHDENSYAQSIPTAFLNDGTKPYKIEAVTCTNVPGGTLGPEAHHGLCRLVKIAIEWVAHEIDALEAQITLELESHDYRDLWNKPTPSFKFATPADVEHRRGSK